LRSQPPIKLAHRRQEADADADADADAEFGVDPARAG
jgi:hypothetical protein